VVDPLDTYHSTSACVGRQFVIPKELAFAESGRKMLQFHCDRNRCLRRF
jgi:hypothetical protein